MFLTILKFLGSSLPSIISQISEERKRQADAKTEQERIASDERIRQLEAQRDVVLASYGNRFNDVVRLLWALPFIIYIWKLILWDKVMEWGVTDPLSPVLEYILWTVLGGYFLERIVRRK